MQQRWQNSIADEAFGSAIGKAGPQPLSVSSCILGVITETSGLFESGPCSRTGEENWMGEIFVG